jgi:hypothetical protein
MRATEQEEEQEQEEQEEEEEEEYNFTALFNNYQPRYGSNEFYIM